MLAQTLLYSLDFVSNATPEQLVPNPCGAGV